MRPNDSQCLAKNRSAPSELRSLNWGICFALSCLKPSQEGNDHSRFHQRLRVF